MYTNTLAQQVKIWGFTLAEVEDLGLMAFYKFKVDFGVDLLSLCFSQLKYLYGDIISNPNKYKFFASWLRKRFEVFIGINAPIRIYVGGEKKFMQRGDRELENMLKKILSWIDEYIDNGYITPSRISSIMFYMNKIVR